jgi:hypothetical protein
MEAIVRTLNNLTKQQITESVDYYFNCPPGGYPNNRKNTKSFYWY